jgi:DNA-directed RNA polymerase specialized sigma24 family protein
MALRRSVAGQRFVDAKDGTCADVAFEAHLPKLAVFCLRLTSDPDEAVLLAERVVLEARRRLAKSPDAARSSAMLFSVLREECAKQPRPAPANAYFSRFKSAPAWK